MGWSPQATLSVGFPRQVYWNRLPLASLGDLPEPEIEPESPASPVLAGGFFTTVPLGKPLQVPANVGILLIFP